MMIGLAAATIFLGIGAPLHILSGPGQVKSNDTKAVRGELKKAYARYDQAVRKNNAATLIEFLRSNTLPSYSRLHNNVTTSRAKVITQLRDEAKRLGGRIWMKLLLQKTELGAISVRGSEVLVDTTQVTVIVYPDTAGSPGGSPDFVKDRVTRRARDTWVKGSGGWKLRHTHILSVQTEASYIPSPN